MYKVWFGLRQCLSFAFYMSYGFDFHWAVGHSMNHHNNVVDFTCLVVSLSILRV